METRLIFKSDDFYSLDFDNRHKAADLANAKLNALIDALPTVYGSEHKTSYQWTVRRCLSDTHQAKLMFIEPIIKEKCAHEQVVNVFIDRVYPARPFKTTCIKCGVELIATWSEK